MVLLSHDLKPWREKCGAWAFPIGIVLLESFQAIGEVGELHGKWTSLLRPIFRPQ
jgi:hypothetical protein